MNDTSLIGIDWGTSNVRGFRYGGGGHVVETLQLDAGLRHVVPGAWEAAFRSNFGDWVDASPRAAVLMSGMAGSRQGWSETPYVQCPVFCDALATRLHPVAGSRVQIVPGLCTFAGDGTPDVMRGEETQLAGLVTAGLPEGGCYTVCLPGTHSKWVELDSDRIVTFRTLMTGELFEVLLHHSLLGRMAETGGSDEAAFLRGVERGFTSTRLLHDLFGVRTLRLFDRLAATSAPDYLSGLLIGSELSCAAQWTAPEASVVLVGSRTLTARYEAALRHIGRTAIIIDGETAAACGLWRIAARAGLIADSTEE